MPFTFTAPNLQYLMDSPSEFSGFSLRTFRVAGTPGSPLFRFAAHHQGTDADLDAFAGDVQKVVTEARHVFGEYPAFEGNTYTFIADYLPWANGDAMEHRNSTALSSAVVDPHEPLSASSTPSHTSSSTSGTWSASGRGRSSRSTSRMPTCRASCGSRKGSPATTGRSSSFAPVS